MNPDHPFPPPELEPHRIEDVERAFRRFTREAVLVRIRNGQVSAEERPGFEDRNACVIELVRRTAAVHPLPDATLLVFTGDVLRSNEPNEPWIAAFSRREGEKRLLFPNFNFVHHQTAGIGPWETVSQELLEESQRHPWTSRDPRVFFAGAATNPMRTRLARATATDPRFLVEVGSSRRWTLLEHASFQWLLNINGWGYSGRLHYLMATGGAVIQLRDCRSTHRWQEFWTPLLQSGRHMLVVDYHRWEPIFLIKKRIMATMAKANGTMLAELGRSLIESKLTPVNIFAYVVGLVQCTTATQC